MSKIYSLTPTNGFDQNNLNNARQNNYAWSMNELGDYLYVGTGRNIPINIINTIVPDAALPALIKPDPIDSLPEIWRYKKNGELPWEKVYKAADHSGMTGFRYMIQHCPYMGSPALYAASYGDRVQIVKSTNGVNWFVLPDTVLAGTSSRAMVTHKGKLYVATIDEENPGMFSQLYVSEDPEFEPWKPVIDYASPDFIKDKNPSGAISNMAVFNNRIYIATSSPEGFSVYRTNGQEPELNGWTLIGNHGLSDQANVYTLSMGVFKNHLYVSGTKQLPLAWLIPTGCDVFRIDKCDCWELIVGGNPFLSKRKSLSGLDSGFDNPFNVYAWQIQEFQGKLYISTFDDSSNMELILNILLANREALYNLIGQDVTELLIGIYKTVVKVLREIHYPIGFDLYVSEDGVHFNYINLTGLDNPNNYGGRILFVDQTNHLYLGTANPFQGCEVWKFPCFNYKDSQMIDESYSEMLRKAAELMKIHEDSITRCLPILLQFLSQEKYQDFKTI